VLTNVVVEDNLIINCNCQCWMLDCSGVTQGVIANQMGGMTIRNNLFINSGQSGFIDLPYVSVYNNLFYNWGWGNNFAICIAPAHGQWGGGDHARVKNNVFYGTNSGSYDFTYGPPVDLQADYNYIPSSKGEAHGIVGGTPGFVNVGVNFHLLTNSILRNAGINLTSFFTTGFDGNTRPSSGAWDIGAYQFSSVSNINLAPPVPSGLLGVVLSTANYASLTIQALGSASWASSLQYNFGDGSYTNFGNTNTASAIHTYASPGTYTVTLIASNNVSGRSVSGSQVITVTQ
jgi:PKD repeat protein